MQVPAQPHCSKVHPTHIECSVLWPPKYLPTHLGSNSINVGQSSKIVLTSVELIDNQFTPSSLQRVAPRPHMSLSKITKDSNCRSAQHLYRSRPGSSRCYDTVQILPNKDQICLFSQHQHCCKGVLVASAWYVVATLPIIVQLRASR